MEESRERVLTEDQVGSRAQIKAKGRAGSQSRVKGWQPGLEESRERGRGHVGMWARTLVRREARRKQDNMWI